MYFIRNEDDEKSDDEQNSNLERSIDVDDDDIKLKPNDIFNGKNNSEKRVYGRARANLCYSSFYIFCEDFRKQLDYVYAHESEFYRKSMLSHMWKHLNVRDKHKYYETATKARTMYNLPGHLENGQEKPIINSAVLDNCTKHSNEVNNVNQSNSSNVVGKLVKVQFLKSCTAPIITPLKVQDVVNHLESVRVHHSPDKLFEKPPQQDHGKPSDNTCPVIHALPDSLGAQHIDLTSTQVVHAERKPLNPAVSLLRHQEQEHRNGGAQTSSTSASEDYGWEAMLQQYQQQPDYTPYGGYGVQPNSGYFNYAATESSWYGSPSSVGGSGGDHTLMHGGLSHNSCNTHIGDSAGNFLNHGYHQTTSTAGATSSSAESFAASNNHPGVSGVNMDPMADFLGGHQNMNETDKIIKEESIDWLSTIINNDEVDQQGNRQDLGEGGGGSSGGGGSGNGKLAVGDLPPHKGGQESNGRLPNFHQAFGSTEIGRFSQHEYYEPPKDTDQISGECQGQQGPTRVAGGTGVGRSEEHQQPSTVTFEPPRQQNRRGRTQRGGGQHRRNSKQTRTAVAAAAAAAAAAAQQYVGGYDVTGSTMVTGTGRHQHQMPPYHHHHHDPYGRNQQHAHQRYHHQEYHHHHQQPPPSPSYQHHQQEYYPRPYDRMHHGYQQQQQQQQLLPPQPSTNHQSSYYNNNREQSYTGGGGSYNRFHSCCSTEHSSIARPNHHHNYGGGGPGQYYGDYNTSYSQW